MAKDLLSPRSMRFYQGGLNRWWLMPLLGIVALSWLVMRPPLAPGVTVGRHAILHTVVASGRVATLARVQISSPLVGTLREVLADKGDIVHAGQALARLDDRELRASVTQAETGVKLAQQRLQRLQAVATPLATAALTQARITLEQARRQAAHADTLAQGGHIGLEARDEARDALALRQSQLEAARLQSLALAPGGLDLELARAELKQAEAALNLARQKLSWLTLTAPASGRLLTRLGEPGQVVQPGMPLFLFAPDTPPLIRVQIDEKNYAQIALNQPARVRPDAWPTQTLAARVSRIAPAVDAEHGAVEVELTPDSPDERLREDMTVSVEIRISEKADALTVNSLAIHDLQGGEPWVWLIDDGRIQRRAVTLGARGNGDIEILTGLVEGDRVVAAPTLVLTEGQRVRTGDLPP